MLVYSHDRPPPPPPPDPPDPPREPPHQRKPWYLDEFRRLLLLVAGLGVALASSLFSPLPAYALLLLACVLIGRGLGGIVQSTAGLRDHHQ